MTVGCLCGQFVVRCKKRCDTNIYKTVLKNDFRSTTANVILLEKLAIFLCWYRPSTHTGPNWTKTCASAGNRTRAARVAGEHSTTEPPMRMLAAICAAYLILIILQELLPVRNYLTWICPNRNGSLQVYVPSRLL